jgi:hypothetical protein
MGKIYNIQLFHLYFTYNELPGTFVSAIIKYRRPDGITGYFQATHDPVQKLLYYNSPVGEKITHIGKWVFWCVVTISSGEEIPSEPVSHIIYKEGT